MTKKSELAKELMLENPSITENRRLAKLLHSKYEAIFPTIDSARDIIRYIQNKKGDACARPTNAPFIAKLKKMRESIKQDLSEHINTTPYNLPKKYKNVLSISDTHGSYCDLDALDMALEYGYKTGVDAIIINGDFEDFKTISKFLSKPNSKRALEEVEVCKNLLNYIQKSLGVKVVYHEGNHSSRFENYLINKAPELWGLAEVTLKHLYGCNEKGIDYVENERYMNVGKLAVTHGNHVVKGIFAPVNAARGVFTKTNTSTLIGHVHRTSEHIETDMRGNVIGCYSQGCLTTLKPEYNPQVSKHNLGFARIEIVSDKGEFQLHNKKIINNKVL